MNETEIKSIDYKKVKIASGNHYYFPAVILEKIEDDSSIESPDGHGLRGRETIYRTRKTIILYKDYQNWGQIFYDAVIPPGSVGVAAPVGILDGFTQLDF